MKKTLFLNVLVLLVTLSISVATAQTKQPVLVSTVNIQDAKIVSQEENVFRISFLLTNKEGMQTGVKYGVKLVQNIDNKQILVDEVVYPEVLTLMPESKTLREITYTAPELLTGTYAFVLYASNNSGFPFGISYVGDVTIYSELKGVSVVPESCSLSIDGKMRGLLEGATVSDKSTVQLNCIAINTLNRDVMVTPMYKTYAYTVYGEEVKSAGGSFAPITLASGARTPITLTLPKAEIPRAHTVVTSLVAPDIESNKISARYVLAGQSATITNATFNKESYEKGETATISLLWSGTTAVTLEGTIKSKSGRVCSEAIEQKLTLPKEPITEVKVAMKRDCNNPRLSLTLKNEDGKILDQKEFAIESAPSASEQKKMVKIGTYVLAGAALIAIATVFLKRRRGNQTINSETI